MALPETELQPETAAPLGRDEFVKRRQDQRAAAVEAEGGDSPAGVAAEEAAAESAAETDLAALGDEEAVEAAPEPTLEPPVDAPAAETPANKVVPNEHAEADQALAQAWQDLKFRANKPPYSDAELSRIADEETPEDWIKANSANKAHKDKIESERVELGGKIQTRQQELQAKYSTDLTTLIPAWSKPEVRQKEGKEISAYLSSLGFSEAEQARLGGTMDARLVTLARDATRYSQAMARKRAAAKPGAAKPGAAPGGRTAATRTGSNATTTLEAAEKRYRKTPSADNFAALRAIKRQQQGAAQ